MLLKIKTSRPSSDLMKQITGHEGEVDGGRGREQRPVCTFNKHTGDSDVHPGMETTSLNNII